MFIKNLVTLLFWNTFSSNHKNHINLDNISAPIYHAFLYNNLFNLIFKIKTWCVFKHVFREPNFKMNSLYIEIFESLNMKFLVSIILTILVASEKSHRSQKSTLISNFPIYLKLFWKFLKKFIGLDILNFFIFHQNSNILVNKINCQDVLKSIIKN